MFFTCDGGGAAYAEIVLNLPDAIDPSSKSKDSSENKLTLKRAEDLVFIHNNLRLLSRSTDQYNEEKTMMWDVGGDDFGTLEDIGFLEFASLSLDEPELESQDNSQSFRYADLLSILPTAVSVVAWPMNRSKRSPTEGRTGVAFGATAAPSVLN
ncbi:hypothetical protein Tco_1108630 [Tanacetum coccineum]